MQMSDQLHAPADFPQGKKLPVPIGWETDESQRRSGRGGRDKKIPTCAGNRTPVVQPVATHNTGWAIPASLEKLFKLLCANKAKFWLIASWMRTGEGKVVPGL
jgi:hypothetical protein